MTAAGGEWTLLDPWFLGLAPLAWAALAWRWRREHAALSTPSLDLVARLPRSLRARLVGLPAVLLAVAVTALALALARPVRRELVPLHERGVDILLLIDISSSMGLPDMQEGSRQRRVEAARDQALAFAKGRTSDRVGLMTFALFPELRCPLTLDHDALSAFLRAVDCVAQDSPENRTAIGVALAQAVRVLEKSTARSKVVVLLTDGENNVDDVPPADAAKLAADAGVRVHTIGLGHGNLLQDPFGGARLVPADFSAIQGIAKVTGGRFFRAQDADALQAVYGEIDRMEKVEIEDPRYRTIDAFGWPLLAGAAAALLSLLLDGLWIRGAP